MCERNLGLEVGNVTDISTCYALYNSRICKQLNPSSCIDRACGPLAGSYDTRAPRSVYIEYIPIKRDRGRGLAPRYWYAGKAARDGEPARSTRSGWQEPVNLAFVVQLPLI
eukprot:COSAG02_NODE_2134_length_9720_cov_3.845027_4_plen_111_part_00